MKTIILYLHILSGEDRSFIGVYPLKGKRLNVRGELVKR
jgi:DNA gyrase/topoisomerase IV subunit B